MIYIFNKSDYNKNINIYDNSSLNNKTNIIPDKNDNKNVLNIFIKQIITKYNLTIYNNKILLIYENKDIVAK